MARKPNAKLSDVPVIEKGGDPVSSSPVTVTEPPAINLPALAARAYQEWAALVPEHVPAWETLDTLAQQGFLSAAQSILAGRAPVTKFDSIFYALIKG